MSLHNVAFKEGPKNRKIIILHPRSYTDHPQNIPDCPLCHGQPIPKISWKSTHPLNVANRHAAAPRWETVKQSRQAWNSLDNYFLGRPWHFMKISWKYITLLINTHPGNRKNEPGFKGLNATSQKCYKSLLISCAIFFENFMKIRSSVFP